MNVRLLTLVSLVVVTTLLVPLGTRPIAAAQLQPVPAVAPASKETGGQVLSLARSPMKAALGSAPLMFIDNVGQFDEKVRFHVTGRDRSIWLTDEGLWINVKEHSSREAQRLQRRGSSYDRRSVSMPERGVNLKLSFVGANPHPRIEPLSRLDTRVSYFITDSKYRWRSNVPVWGGVRYVDLYPGLDLEISGEAGDWTWRMVADTKVELSQVRLRVDGAKELALDGDRLVLGTALGSFTLPLIGFDIALQDHQPATREIDRETFEVRWPFACSISSPQTVIASSLSGASSLAYSTFLGGGGLELTWASIVDSDGALYVTGYTSSSDFPATVGVYDAGHNGSWDVFVAKISADGQEVLSSTFIGGSNRDEGFSFALDASGNVVVGGETWSSNFPTTTGAFDTTYNGGYADAFVLKLSPDLSSLLYSTYLGGAPILGNNGHDRVYSLALDDMGNTVVAGYTRSPDFPTTPEAYDTTYAGDCDAFVARLSADGSALLDSTFVGGGGTDGATLLSLDDTGNVLFTGFTKSIDFPTTLGAYDTSHGGDFDAFVARLSADLGDLLCATYAGGGSVEMPFGLAADAADDVVIFGYTDSSNLSVTAQAYDTTFNGVRDAFLLKLSSDLSVLRFSTFLGGVGSDEASGVMVIDATGNLVMFGDTYSDDFPTTSDAFDGTRNGGRDLFLTVLSPEGSQLLYSTFIGGEYDDFSAGLTLEASGIVYLTGRTYSPDFPTTVGALDTTYGGGGDAYVVKARLNMPPTVGANGPYNVDEGESVVVTATGSDPESDPLTFAWDLDNDGIFETSGQSVTFSAAGFDGPSSHNIAVQATDSGGLCAIDQTTVNVLNVVPTVDAGPDASVDEGDGFYGSGSFTDPGADTWEATVDYGDGSGIQLLALLGNSFELNHTYVEDGTYTVTVCVTDDDAGTGCDERMVTVNNVVPTVDAGADQSVGEGDPVFVNATFSDPGTLDAHSATIDWSDGVVTAGAVGVGGTVAGSHTYVDDGIYEASVEVCDDDGGCGDDILVVAVNNVAPTVGPITAPTDPVQVNSEVVAAADFADAGVNDTHTALWEWGDGGTSLGTVDETNGSGTVSGGHIYTIPGVYTIKLTVIDKDGDSGESVFQFAVVYDPDGGFVTGGGWIESPLGAYSPEPSLTGRANFGFVSKYKKGADVPTGQTEFQFRVADLSFHSESYDWLVVAGPRAQFKGSGTINGVGNYGFMLTAIDAQLTPSTEVDKFRIKIWDKNNDDVVIYDNQMGALDDAIPTTVIRGGAIVIHKK